MLTFTDDDFKASIQKESGIKPSGPPRRSSTSKKCTSIARIKASPFIPRKDWSADSS